MRWRVISTTDALARPSAPPMRWRAIGYADAPI